jgi:PAS domain S-box-containing protein
MPHTEHSAPPPSAGLPPDVESEDRKALAQAAERYRQVVENLGEGMGVIQDGVTVYVNPRAAEMLERTPSDMLGCSFLDWVHPDDHAVVAERQRRRQRGEAVPERYELRCVTGTGQVRWMSTRASALMWEGQPATMTFFTDVTEQRSTLEALRSSEKRYRTVVQQLGEGMMVIQQGTVTFANSQAAALLGRPPETLIGLHALEVVHPDDRLLVGERLRARESGVPLDVHTEFRIVRPDGAERWLNTHSSNADWEGRPATLTFFSDHTEQRRMLDALHRSEERYRMVVEHVGDGMVVVQGERFMFANQRAAEIFEMSVDDMLAHGYLHRIHPDDHDVVQDRRRRRLAGEPVPNRYEIRLQMPDGRVKWIDIGVTLVPWEGGLSTLTFFSDISHRKELEHTLTQTLAERETVLNTSVVGIAFLTATGRFRWANPAMLHLFGAPADGSFNSMEVVYPSRAQYLEVGGNVASAIARGEGYQTEVEMRRLDGRQIWVSLSGQAVNRADLSAGTVWTVLDITQRKQAEQDIRQALQQQKELNDLRSRFVSMTSHEFRTPLATILSSAELLRFYGDRMPAQERLEVIASIESGVQRMTQMLDRVLVLGRSEAGMLEFNPRRQDLAQLCRHICDEARTTQATHTHTVTLRLSPGAIDGWFDDRLLRHALGNLLSNAIKYSPQGGEVSVDVTATAATVLIAVQDGGIGIPEAEIPHLFTSFHRASNVGEIKGTGLGLAIVKNAVELHGGTLSVRSELMRGTCFSIRLPWQTSARP